MNGLAALCDAWGEAVLQLATPDEHRSWLDYTAERVIDLAEAEGLALTDEQLVWLSWRLPEPLALELLRRRLIRQLVREAAA